MKRILPLITILSYSRSQIQSYQLVRCLMFANSVERSNEKPVSMCCSGGKVKLEPPHPPHFQSHYYRSCSMIHQTRVTSRVRSEIIIVFSRRFFLMENSVETGYMLTFKVQGQGYHWIKSLRLEDGQPSQFLQIFDLYLDIVTGWETILVCCTPVIDMYKNSRLRLGWVLIVTITTL